MYKKEFKDVLIQTLIFLGIMSAASLLPVIAGDGGKSLLEWLAPILQVGLLCFSFFLGASWLESERKQRGMEYLFSLPYSRSGLLARKILPRSAVLLALYIFYLLLFSGPLGDFSVIGSSFYPVICLSFFILSAAVAPTTSSFPLLALTALGANAIYFASLILVYMTSGIFNNRIGWLRRPTDLILLHFSALRSPWWDILAAIVLLTPFIIGMIAGMKKLDAHSSAGYNKKILRSSLLLFPALLLSGILVYFSYGAFPPHIIYTAQNQVITITPMMKAVITDTAGTTRIPCDFFPMSGFSRENSFYGVGYRSGGFQLYRLDLREKKFENLFLSHDYIQLVNDVVDNQLLFISRVFERKENSDKTETFFFNLATKKIEKVLLSHEKLHFSYFMGSAHTGGQKSYIFASRPARGKFRMFRVQNKVSSVLPQQSIKSPLLVNNMILYAEKEAWVFARLTETGDLETIRKIPEAKEYTFSSGYEAHIWSAPVKTLIGESNNEKTKDKLLAINLETFALSAIPVKTGFLRFRAPGAWYYFTTSGDPRERLSINAVYAIKNDALTLIRAFSDSQPEFRFDWGAISSHAIIIQNNHNVKILPFPELRELSL